MKATAFGRGLVTPVSVGTRRDGNQLYVTVAVDRDGATGPGVKFDPPIEVVAGDTVHFEITAEHRDPAAMSASFFRHEQDCHLAQGCSMTGLYFVPGDTRHFA